MDEEIEPKPISRHLMKVSNQNPNLGVYEEKQPFLEAVIRVYGNSSKVHAGLSWSPQAKKPSVLIEVVQVLSVHDEKNP